ncbi:MAG TPA: ABC transporter permease [Candidatus Limnocylindria bacterium]|nr:ABC transporter permease [Candidatus Limnocylindria bacterium]
MVRYAIRRVLLLVPTLFLVALITFVLAQAAPGSPFDRNPDKPLSEDARARLNALYGLDRPIHEQFAIYVANAVRLDFGNSIISQRPVVEIIGNGLPRSAQLGIQALLVAVAIALPLGVVSALKQNTLVDYGSVLAATIGTTIPSFVIGLMLIYVFGVTLKWVPFIGWGEGCGPLPSCDFRRMILPTLVLALGPAAYLMRITRASMLDVIRQDFVRTARAKGLRENVVVVRHALRNALIPVITILGPATAALIVGTFFIEYIFSIPGSGGEYIRAIRSRDYPVIMATTLLYAFFIALGNLVVDLAYGVVDPRMKVAK